MVRIVSPLDSARALLESGKQFLRVAQLALEHDPNDLAQTVFASCQDAVGRLLAGYLLATGCEVEKIRDFQGISQRAREVYPEIHPLLEPLLEFAEHFLASRYPCEDGPEFSAESAAEVLRKVEQLERFIRDRIERNSK